MLNAETVLILIDDDEAHTVLITRHLKKADINNPIICFHSGQQALDFIFSECHVNQHQSGKSMLIILDINMPGMSGINVLNELKSSALTRSIPVIMFTTADEPKEINACYQIGCNAYIIKPVSYQEFVVKIHDLGIFLKMTHFPRFL